MTSKKWRWLHIAAFRRKLRNQPPSADEACMFHANPRAHLRLNPESGEFEEIANPYPTPEPLYQLCDKEHVYNAFKDAFEVQDLLAKQHFADVNRDVLASNAAALDVETDFSSAETTPKPAEDLLQRCALKSSMYVVDRAKTFADKENKRLAIFLSYSRRDVVNACKSGRRFDRDFVDFLKQGRTPFVDSLEKHVEDYKSFACPAEEYTDRYYIGHYNPIGNHFFVFAVKDAVVAWLDPKPPAYCERGPPTQSMAATLA